MLKKINQLTISTTRRVTPWFNKHQKARNVASSLRSVYCGITGSWHVLPDFLIIGARKSGTTSLYRNIVKHPCAEPCFNKEVDYFTRYYNKGPNWYRSLFPLSSYKQYSENILKRKFVTGEATTTYLYHPHTPKRVKELLPDVKLIAILRNPIDRAYSQYQMEVGHGNENLSFEEAIEKEEERINEEYERMLQDEKYYSIKFQTFAYLRCGIYAEQLERWFKYFPREHFLILDNERFKNSRQEVFNEVFEFLGIPKWNDMQYKQFQKRKYPKKMEDSTRQKLLKYFKPHNEKLFELINMRFNWDS